MIPSEYLKRLRSEKQVSIDMDSYSYDPDGHRFKIYVNEDKRLLATSRRIKLPYENATKLATRFLRLVRRDAFVRDKVLKKIEEVFPVGQNSSYPEEESAVLEKLIERANVAEFEISKMISELF